MYEKLDTKEIEKDIYRIARIRERKTRDFCTMRCVILVEEIKERWIEYFERLFNGSST